MAFLWRNTKRLGVGLLSIGTVATAVTVAHDYWLSKTPDPDPIGIPIGSVKTFTCDGDWVHKVFGCNSESIPSLQITTLSGGYSGPSISRITVTHETDGNKCDLPPSFIAKYCSIPHLPEKQNLFERVFGIFNSLEDIYTREVHFYQTLQDETNKSIRSPKAYYSSIEDYGRRSPLTALFDKRTSMRVLMLLEDLGTGVVPIGTHLTGDRMHSSVEALAKLHAHFWDTPKTDFGTATIYRVCFGLPWLTKMFVSFYLKESKIENAREIWRDSTDPLMAQIFSDPQLTSTISTLCQQYKNKIYPYCSTSKLGNSELFQHHTFLHGDYHPGNQFLDKDGNVVMIDWQFCGLGDNTTEFIYFLNTSVVPDKEGDTKLMQRYYDNLISNGVDSKKYPFSVFEKECALRVVSLASFYLFVLFVDTPDQRLERIKDNPVMADLEKLIPALIQKSLIRASHVIDRYGPELNIVDSTE